MTVIEVATQGRADNPQWVTAYHLQYTTDGINWLSVDSNRLFAANTDQTTVVKNTLPNPVRARAIRIVPFTWVGHISMRAEVYILRNQ